MVASLATLPRADIEELIRDGEVLEIRCDYCGKEYQIPPAQLRAAAHDQLNRGRASGGRPDDSGLWKRPDAHLDDP